MARFQTPEEVLDAVQRHFLPEKAGNTRAVVQLHLTGEGGGDWVLTIADGALDVAPGVAPAPDLSFSAAVEDFLAMANGEMDAMKTYFSGKVRFKGSLRLAYRLADLFRMPGGSDG